LFKPIKIKGIIALLFQIGKQKNILK